MGDTDGDGDFDELVLEPVLSLFGMETLENCIRQ
jgi:hypothetical protein